MTKADIKETLKGKVDSTTTAEEFDTLTQIQITEITNALANELGETVNPNGPCYPSTPR